jgi:hypothetical protein
MIERTLRPAGLAELLDQACWLYRARFRAYMWDLAFPLLGLGVFGLEYLRLAAFGPGPLFALLALGGVLPGGATLQATFVREVFFADGAVFWTITAAVLAPATARAYFYSEMGRREGWSLPGSVWGMALLVGLPVMALRLVGAGLLADFIRLPAMFAPQIMVLERASIRVALRRSWGLVRRDFVRVLALFALVLVLVRLAAALPFAALLFGPWLFELPLPRLGVFAPLCALLAQLLIYPASQVAVTLLYYDLRARREGLDIAVAASRWSQEATDSS